jgi:hypothetical protein
MKYIILLTTIITLDLNYKSQELDNINRIIKEKKDYSYEAIRNKYGVYDSLHKKPYSYEINRFNKDGLIIKKKAYYKPFEFSNNPNPKIKTLFKYPKDNIKTISYKLNNEKIKEVTETDGIFESSDGTIDSSNYNRINVIYSNGTLSSIFNYKKTTTDSLISIITTSSSVKELFPIYYSQQTTTKNGLVLNYLFFIGDKLIEQINGKFIDTNFIEETFKFNNFDTLSRRINIYDSKNKLISKSEFIYSQKIEHQANGITLKLENSPVSKIKTSYKYSNSGLLEESMSIRIKLNENNKLDTSEISRFVYDIQGNIIQETKLNNNVISYQMNYERDSVGKLIKATRWFFGVDENSYEYYYYNSYGDLIQIDYLFKDCIYKKHVFKYKYYK